MSYKYSRGSQVIGDLKAADDAQRDTKIDFGEDKIEFQTSGSTRLSVENNEVVTFVPLHISGSWLGHEALRIGATTTSGRNFREIVFERDGEDKAFIQIDSSNGLIIGCASDSDEIIFMTQTGGTIQEAMRVRHGAVGIGTDNPTEPLHVSGNVKLTGNLVVANYTLPTTDGSANQVIQTNGSGQLSFVDVDDGGGGGGGSATPQVLKAGLNYTFDLSGSAQFQTVPLDNVSFDTFVTGGWDSTNYKFVAGEEGYYDISATVVLDELDENPSQYQLWLVSNSDHATANDLVGGYIALVQLAPTPSDMDMATLHINTIAHLSSSQSASLSIRQAGTNNSGTTTVMAPKNRTFICIKKL